MTNILVIGDIVRTRTGHDMVIGFTPDERVMLDRRGVSDEEYFDVIGHYDTHTGKVILHDR